MDELSTTSTINVLVVEDNKIAALVTQTILNGLGCIVDIAVDGDSTLEKTFAKAYDIIFMDIGLPDANGYDIVRQIRNHNLNLNNKTPIIALTAHVNPHEKQKCIESGMNGTLSKPLSEEQAINILNLFVNNNAIKPAQQNQQSSEKIIDFNLIIEKTRSDITFAKNIVRQLIESFPDELQKLTKAYQQNDWNEIQSLAHRLRGATSYCGTPRLQTACTNLENYLNEQKTELRLSLYQKLLDEIEAVKNEFDKLIG